MKDDLFFGVGVLVKSYPSQRDQIEAVAKHARMFFTLNNLFKDPDSVMARAIDDDFEMYLSDLTDVGESIVRKCWYKYLRRFGRDTAADPTDVRILEKALINLRS